MKRLSLAVLATSLLLPGCASSKPSLPRDSGGTMVAQEKSEDRASDARPFAVFLDERQRHTVTVNIKT